MGMSILWAERVPLSTRKRRFREREGGNVEGDKGVAFIMDTGLFLDEEYKKFKNQMGFFGSASIRFKF